MAAKLSAARVKKKKKCRTKVTTTKGKREVGKKGWIEIRKANAKVIGINLI